MATTKILLLLQSLVGTLAVANFDSCSQPSLQWVGLEQGIGRSYADTIANVGTKLVIAGTATENLTYTGPDGVASHYYISAQDLGYYSETGAIAHLFLQVTGMDGNHAMLWPIKATMPQEGTWVFYNRFTGSTPMTDGVHVGLCGSFMGNITWSNNQHMYTANVGRRNYEVFVVKMNIDNGDTVWAKHLTNTGDDTKRRQAHGVSSDAAGNLYVAGMEDVGDDEVGLLTKLASADGAVAWTLSWTPITELYAVAAAADGSTYVLGKLKGTAVMLGTLGPFTSATDEDGDVEESNVVMKVSAVGVPVWAMLIGENGGSSASIILSPDGSKVFFTGEMREGAFTSGTITMTGAEGAFLACVDTATGVLDWAEDMPELLGLSMNAADPNSIFLGSEYRPSMTIGGHVLQTVGDQDAGDHGNTNTQVGRDTMVAKFKTTGQGIWAMRLGGEGHDRMSDMTATSDGGVVVVGASDSATISFGTSSITTVANMNHPSNNGDGDSTFHVSKISGTETIPSCVTSCTLNAEGTAATRTIDPNFCYIANECWANDLMSPYQSCFQCKVATNPTGWTGPNTDNHCFIGGICYSSGDPAPQYTGYHGNSECEMCDPTQNTIEWSIKTGYAHDRDQAYLEKGHGGRGSGSQVAENGMIFDVGSGGCQQIPDVPLTPAAAAVTAAIPAAAAFSFIKRLIGAIDTISAASVTAADLESVTPWQVAAVHYGSYAESTATAPFVVTNVYGLDAHYGSNLHYGTSHLNVENLQALTNGYTVANTGAALFEDTTVAADIMENKHRFACHAQVVVYQAALLQAYLMDTAASTADKTSAHEKIVELWTYLTTSNPSTVSAAMGSAAYLDVHAFAKVGAPAVDSVTNGMFYCKMAELLHHMLPCTTATGDAINYTKAEDLGTLALASSMDCTFPSPPPPSKPPPSMPPPDGGLTSGQTIGIAVGGAAGALFIIALLVLASRQKMKGEPLMHCIHDVNCFAEKKPPDTGNAPRNAPKPSV